MLVIKQLSEDEFVIKKDESDLSKESRMIVAHDYVQFGANMGIFLDSKADWSPTGKFAICGNWIKGYTNVQVDIRTFIKVVLPHVLANVNCQEDHLKGGEGKLRYNWETSPLIFTNNEGKKVVALKGDDGEYTLLPIEAYNQTKKLVKEE